eukprot:215355_1
MSNSRMSTNTSALPSRYGVPSDSEEPPIADLFENIRSQNVSQNLSQSRIYAPSQNIPGSMPAHSVTIKNACPKCNKSFTYMKSWINHVQICTGKTRERKTVDRSLPENNFICQNQFCKATTVSGPSDYPMDTPAHKVAISPNETIKTCKPCYEFFRTKKSLRKPSNRSSPKHISSPEIAVSDNSHEPDSTERVFLTEHLGVSHPLLQFSCKSQCIVKKLTASVDGQVQLNTNSLDNVQKLHNDAMEHRPG